ncbi:uncharacterized protein LOC114130300 [Aphis gossypii]|uniref:uncharacterized protein LOC114130300 n=1 Tax=Aphis gossypii TaxID=80765 RepID=UPI0021590856|nr:uncharacterized protein LOC114130300 [Aphis gossypii]
MIILKVFILIGFFYLVKSKTTFMSNLPLGEYRTVYERIYYCQSTNTFQSNLYFNKRTSNITEMKGNFSFSKPLDDSYSIDINAESWSLTGGWKPNSMVYLSKNACSSLKMFFGKAGYSMYKSFKFPKYSCPIPAGTYISSGIDLKEIEDHNFPKVYFYGRYKVIFKIKDIESNILGCGVIELSLIRPWEIPI